MDGRSTWTDCDVAGDYVVPNVLSPRDLVSIPDIMDENVPHTGVSNQIIHKPNCPASLRLETRDKIIIAKLLTSQ